MIKRKYGWRRDLPDHRDLKYKSIAPFKVWGTLPSKVDLRDKCSPVFDQGSLGSCSGNALAGALEFLELKDGLSLTNLSRLFIYYNERLVEGTIDQDTGAMIRDGIKTLAKYGACSELLFPYDVNKFTQTPTEEAYNDGDKHQITSYFSIDSLRDIKKCLADQYPVVMGFSVYESFESEEVAKTGIVPMPMSYESMVGGHAVLIVGYNDETKRFIVRNSWGTGWGIGGYFELPFDFYNKNLIDDCWTIRKGENL